jgi:nitrate reductase NapAB chaperone NapD
MAIAGAVVAPVNKESEKTLKDRLDSINGLEVQGIGEKGIAVVIEADDIERLRRLSEDINKWEEVIDVQLSYLNWEEVGE